jgi:hypothetical protein
VHERSVFGRMFETIGYDRQIVRASEIYHLPAKTRAKVSLQGFLTLIGFEMTCSMPRYD